MYRVSKERFYKYIRDNDLKESYSFICSNWSDYVNNEGVIKARVESSSWNPDIFYKIDDNSYESFDDFIFMSKLLNR